MSLLELELIHYVRLASGSKSCNKNRKECWSEGSPRPRVERTRPVVGISAIVFQIPVTGSWTRPRVAPARPRGQPSVTWKTKTASNDAGHGPCPTRHGPVLSSTEAENLRKILKIKEKNKNMTRPLIPNFLKILVSPETAPKT
ncbi:hypothetical protein HanRHA438_Chr04g0183111 [Helianthus annuus]|nr:hypothetical protein HanRHA438_Chr04g0183111 [Helianthus annuus]